MPNRIWFVGDSITALAVEPNGFRKAANDSNVAREWGLDFVGTRNDGAWTDNAHDGFPTGKIEDRITKVSDTFGSGLAIVNARVVATLLGTNDARDAGYNRADKIAKYLQWYRLFRTRDPLCRLIVSTVPFIDPAVDAPAAALGLEMNAWLPEVWATIDAENRGNPLFYWSAFAALGSNPANMDPDGIHPNATGHLLMTNAFMPVYHQAASSGRVYGARAYAQI